MRMLIHDWLDREFVALAGEGPPALSPAEQAQALIEQFDQRLRSVGLSLEHTVRTRLWGRDRPSRDSGSGERVRLLAGGARSVSSSYIAPEHFDSEASVALDLLAMRPSEPGPGKTLVEYDPPIVPLRYLVYDSVVFLSGVTSETGNLDEQVAEILPRISGSLGDAQTAWGRAVRVSSFLHRSQSLDRLKGLLAPLVPSSVPRQYGFADGYSTPGKLVEIEVTAQLAK